MAPPLSTLPEAPGANLPPKPKKAESSGPPALRNNKDRPKPPSPPLKIRDGATGVSYTRLGLLGEGGFARVYEVVNPSGVRMAAKVVYKERLDDAKKKTRLYAEIKIHRMMIHPHIVRFHECFEDTENVYMVLDLCPNGSMVELLRRRRYFTPEESRYWLLQIISACQYMHKNRVMHRDLKLGNLMLDKHMNLKLGDFGLAALIEHEGDRRKTVCGTPNYIAPEVLYGKNTGHSYEADVWSVGVTLYTMLVGKPPFQTKEVKNIYRRIKELNYSFPEEADVDEDAQELITLVLTHDPNARLTLEGILKHEWFRGSFPSHIPTSALEQEPVFNITPEESKRNYALAKDRSAVGRNLPIGVPAPPPSPARGMSGAQARQAVAPAVAEQERDFKKAVQPDSPISDLLSSARKPLVVAPQPVGTRDAVPLMRRFAASGAGSGSPLRREVRHDGGSRGKALAKHNEDDEDEIEEFEEGKVAPTASGSNQRRQAVSPMRDRAVMSAAGRVINAKSPLRHSPAQYASTSQKRRQEAASVVSERTQASLYDRMVRNIDEALDCQKRGIAWRPKDAAYKPEHPRHFIASWLDYCTKYGMGYALTDGSVGVTFNDASMLILAPNRKTFDCIEPDEAEDGTLRYTKTSHSIESYPSELDNRVYLINHFSDYLNRKLNAPHSWTYKDMTIQADMVYATKYLRTKHVILFRLSNDLMQFNFYDHTKLLIFSEGRIISFIDKDYELHTWTLAHLTQQETDGLPRPERKLIEQVLHKVGYCRDLLSKVEQYMKAGPRKQRATKTASMNGTEGFDRGVDKVEAGS